MILKPVFALSRFFINTYGLFLKFFLKLNGGYWTRIGLTKYKTEDKIKKRNFYILPFYFLLAFLFGLLSVIYWYFVLLHFPLSLERFLTGTTQLNKYISSIIAFGTFFGWFFILTKTK